MTRKMPEAYEELLAAIGSECASLRLHPVPDVVIPDFEYGAMNVVKAVLCHGTQTRVCFFHLYESTGCKMREFGLVNCYRADDPFRTFVDMLNALAYLPMDVVEDGIGHLCSAMPSIANDLTKYFDSS